MPCFFIDGTHLKLTISLIYTKDLMFISARAWDKEQNSLTGMEHMTSQIALPTAEIRRDSWRSTSFTRFMISLYLFIFLYLSQ